MLEKENDTVKTYLKTIEEIRDNNRISSAKITGPYLYNYDSRCMPYGGEGFNFKYLTVAEKLLIKKEDIIKKAIVKDTSVFTDKWTKSNSTHFLCRDNIAYSMKTSIKRINGYPVLRILSGPSFIDIILFDASYDNCVIGRFLSYERLTSTPCFLIKDEFGLFAKNRHKLSKYDK